jgi:putative transposase
MITKPTLNAQDVRQASIKTAQAHLSINVNGYIVTSEMIFDVLFKAASERISIEAACKDLVEVADSNSIREQLNGCVAIEHLRSAEAEMNAALAANLPAALLRQRVEVAMDTHDEPFYGKSEELRRYCCHSQAKAGTTHFFRIATAYIFCRQVRLTLAITYVLPEETTEAVVKRLYERLHALNLRLAVLYLDRGFCSGAVIQYLKSCRQPAILACTIRGKQGGTRRLCQGRKSYRTSYTFTDGTTAELAVVATLVPNKEGRRRRKWLLFVVLNLDWQPQTVCRCYRFRFGIESSYRLLRQVRIKTTSRNTALRFFLLGFALLLVNVWAFVRCVVARLPGPGPYRINASLFPLHTFCQLLRRAVETIYHVVTEIHTYAPLLTAV